MCTKIGKKSSNFYVLEKLLIGSNSNWFYLYDLHYDAMKNALAIEIGPNNDKADKRKWLFLNVRNLTKYVDNGDEYNIVFPQMIFGVDYYKNYTAMHMVIACEDVEYSFDTTELPKQVDPRLLLLS